MSIWDVPVVIGVVDLAVNVVGTKPAALLKGRRTIRHKRCGDH